MGCPILSAVVCCSTPACMSLLAALPGLARLTSTRKAELQAAFPRLALLLQLLPGGAAALRRHNRCEAWSSFLWAYGTAKTRTTTLSTAAALNIDSKASRSSSSTQGSDGPAGASQAAAGKGLHLLPSALQHAARWGMERLDYVVAWLGSWVLGWRSTSSAVSSTLQLEQLEVVGALVPVLDLANHGSGAEVRAATLQHNSTPCMSIQGTGLSCGKQACSTAPCMPEHLHPCSSSMQAPCAAIRWQQVLSHWLLCVCQVTARLEGRSDYFALVATRDLEPGDYKVP